MRKHTHFNEKREAKYKRIFSDASTMGSKVIMGLFKNSSATPVRGNGWMTSEHEQRTGTPSGARRRETVAPPMPPRLSKEHDWTGLVCNWDKINPCNYFIKAASPLILCPHTTKDPLN